MHREGFISWVKLIEHRVSFYQGCSQLLAYQNNNNKILGLYRLSLPNFNLQVKVNYHNLQFLERKPPDFKPVAVRKSEVIHPSVWAVTTQK